MNNWQCCCNNKTNTCQPCVCVTSYNPNGFSSTELDSVSIAVGNVCSPAFFSPWCTVFPFNKPTGIGANWVGDQLAWDGPYSDGQVVCTAGTFSSIYPFDVARNSGDPLNEICSDFPFIAGAVPCFGNHSDITDATVGWNLLPYPTLGDNDCFPSFPLCSLDSCSSGNISCIPVPYCPTKLKITWDQMADDAGLPQGVALYTTDCPQNDCDLANYNLCQIDSSQRLIDAWVLPTLEQNNNINKFVIPPVCNPTDDNYYDGQTIYYIVAPITILVVGGAPLFEWESTLYLIGCIQQELSLCTSNEVDIISESIGVGGYTGPGCGSCPKSCGCFDYNVPPEYPQSPVTVTISLPISNDASCFGEPIPIPATTLSANFSTTLDYVWSNGPPSCECTFTQADAASYLSQCQNVTVNLATNIVQWVPFFGRQTTCKYPLIPWNLTVYLGDMDGITSNQRGVMVFGPDCNPPANVKIAVYSCPQCNPTDSDCVTVACFDQTLTFTGFCTANGADADCLGAENCCCYNPEGYGVGYFNGFQTVFSGSSDAVIDLCEGIISVNLYAVCPSQTPCPDGVPDNSLILVGTLEI